MSLSLGGTIGASAASSAFGSLGSLFTGGQAYRRQKDLMKMQYSQSKEAATTAYNRQRQFWDAQNTYNLPSAERGRLEQAGLNPALMYGGGSAASTPSQGLSSVPVADAGSAPNVPRTSIENPVDSWLKMAQIDAIKATTEKTRAETPDSSETLRGQSLANDLLSQNIINQKTKSALDSFDLSYKQATADLNVDKLEQSIANMRSQAQQIASDIQLSLDKHQREPLVRDQLTSQIDETAARIAVMEYQKSAIASGNALNSSQIDKLVKETGNLSMLKSLIYNQIQSEGSTAALKKAQASIATLEADRRSGKYGAVMDYIGMYTGALGNLLSGSASLIKSLK